MQLPMISGRNGISFPIRNRAGAIFLGFVYKRSHERGSGLATRKKTCPRFIRWRHLSDSAASFTNKAPAFPPKLSQDEKNCLALFAIGRKKNDIAEALGISASEVMSLLGHSKAQIKLRQRHSGGRRRDRNGSYFRLISIDEPRDG